MRSPLVFCFLLLLARLSAQAVQLSGVINSYTQVLDIDSCARVLTLSDTSGFHAHEYALLIQMQGAEIATLNTSNYGTLDALNSAGLFERVTIDSVALDIIYIRNHLTNTYNLNGHLQLVSFPHILNGIIIDTLRAKPWDGNTGGVLALSVRDTLTMLAPVSADGDGFRGGEPFVAANNNCTWLFGESDYSYGPGNWRGGFKGEGIAVADAAQVAGRGPQANGGGGGNDHNAGGGGGGNGDSGGQGGENDEPSTFGCDGYFPGLGGRPLPNDSVRLFLGGGGGAGHSNNNMTSFGGSGGGIILLEAGVLTGTHPVFSSNGQDGGTANGDGGGGGGAGGSIWLRVDTAPDSLQLHANGGNGGNTINNNQNRCFGPGGGGSGGVIRYNHNGIPASMGGAAGVITGSTNGCNGSTSGATSGAPGKLSALPVRIPESLAPQAEFMPAIAGLSVSFANLSLNASSFWWNFGDGNESNAFAPSHLYGNPGTYAITLYAIAGCDTAAAVRTVQLLSPPVADFAVADTVLDCESVLVDFQNLSSGNADTYTWFFPGGTPSLSMDFAPQVLYQSSGVYAATLVASNTLGADTSTHTFVVQILGFPEADFSYTYWGNGLVQFDNLSQNAASFTWYFGDSTAPVHTPNPQHLYSQSDTFTVTLVADNYCGTSVLQNTIIILLTDVVAIPKADGVRIFPSPAYDLVTVDCSGLTDTPVSYYLLDILGRPLRAKQAAAGKIEHFAVDNLPPGIYYIQVNFSKGSATLCMQKY